MINYTHPDPARAERTRRIVADREARQAQREGRTVVLRYPGQTVTLGRVTR